MPMAKRRRCVDLVLLHRLQEGQRAFATALGHLPPRAAVPSRHALHRMRDPTAALGLDGELASVML